MAERGRFISFEGGEGAGKSTQAKLLKAALEARGRLVLLTREPGGSPGAEEIRKLLVEGEPDRWTPLAETLLFLAARADHVARMIEPALAAGNWVILRISRPCRFAASAACNRPSRSAVSARMLTAMPSAVGDPTAVKVWMD